MAEYAAQAHALLPQKEYGYQNGRLLISAVNGDETRLRRFVENFYLRTWLTLPDNATLQAQVNALAAQGLVSHEAMLQHAQNFAASLFTSTNYLNRNTTNGMYVADLYLAYLQRPPDEGGFAYWKEVLDNNQISRATLRDAFAGVGYSPSEFGGILDALRASGVNDYDRVDRFVNYVYTATSGNGQTGPTVAQRDYERARFDVAEAQNRDAVRALAEQLGTECLSANNWHNPEWSDTEYVRRLYETFLRHAPDQAGWDYWTGEAEKQGRAGVLGAFLEAGAYREQADALYREIYWLVGDHLGTPRLIVSRTGSIASVKRHDYLPFGEELPVGAGGRATSQGYSYTGDSVRQQFTGYERDDETGLDYAQARMFGSNFGRFTSPDPLLASGKVENPQTWNRYVYVLNNPLNCTDPLGLFIWSEALGGSAETEDLEAEKNRLKDTRKQTKDKAERKRLQNEIDRIGNIVERRAAFLAGMREARRAARNLSGSERSAVNASLEMYGDENVNNGVTVALGEEDQRAQGVTGIENGQIIIAFRPNEFSSDTLFMTIAHEGRHAIDARLDILVSGNPSISGNEIGSLVSARQTELDAYKVSFWAAKGNNYPKSMGLTGTETVNFYQPGWATVDAKTLDKALSQLGRGPNSQAGRFPANWDIRGQWK